jgi:hypothetical protein
MNPALVLRLLCHPEGAGATEGSRFLRSIVLTKENEILGSFQSLRMTRLLVVLAGE